MPEGTDALTLALVLTGAGTTVASALIASFVEVLKRLPGIGLLVGRNAAATATICSFVLVAYAYLATTTTPDPATAFAAFVAGVGIAGLSGKAYDVAKSTLSK